MKRGPLILLCGALLLLAGCARDRAPDGGADPPAGARSSEARLRAEGYSRTYPTHDGTWIVGVRPDTAPPLDEPYAREFAIEPADGSRARLDAVAIAVDCTMPQHRHGMHVAPAVERTGPGRFVVRGFELFMEGEWRMTVDVTEGPNTERAEWWVEPR